eukprot:TRINITY_DN21106_c0_g3_i1.p1 TRINITY_DN21106_c0_g3~~TRINITY_DN21106_c0_g3_i1.p1  ORF type:complete len:113 (+),score=9.67 TRINITY_DN21106_c0_g3_i1:2226-2564(+)
MLITRQDPNLPRQMSKRKLIPGHNKLDKVSCRAVLEQGWSTKQINLTSGMTNFLLRSGTIQYQDLSKHVMGWVDLGMTWAYTIDSPRRRMLLKLNIMVSLPTNVMWLLQMKR